ncbi:MAG: type II toxin-antitoxin system VapC family toxin [Pseudomonadota bacterium]
MALVLFDTNILIDALKGYRQAIDELAFWDEPAISVITWMEIYAGAKTSEVGRLDHFMSDFGFEIIHTDGDIMREAARVRSESRQIGPKIALPDAIIIATARTRDLPVITRNTKDFRDPKVRIPYELKTSGPATTVINATSPQDWADGRQLPTTRIK